MAEALTLTTVLLVSVATFSLGFLLGWISSSRKDLKTNMKIRIMVAVVITLVWLFTTVAGIIVASYTVSPLIHGLMGAIVGYFFTEDGLSIELFSN